MLGPFYKLRCREAGRARTIYLGREGPLVDEVRRALAALQAPWRRHRASQATRQVHAAMRRAKPASTPNSAPSACGCKASRSAAGEGGRREIWISDLQI